MRKSVLLLIALFAICLSVFADDSNIVGETQPDIDDVMNAIFDITVDKGLSNVALTVPKDLSDEITQEEMNEIVKELNLEAATKNSDGSITYIITKKQHEELLEELRNSLKQSLSESLNPTDYPSITNVEANDNFTHFTLTTKNEVPDFFERLSVFLLITYSEFYRVFAGEEHDNIIFDFVNAESGEIILTMDTADLSSDS